MFTSIEKASLIRKFSVLFIVMSLLPFLIIAYLFTQYTGNNTIIIDQRALVIFIFLTGFGILAGFWGVRSSFLKIQKLTKQSNELLQKNIPALGKISEESEITQLTRTFNEINKNLEDNIKRLESSKRTINYVLSKIALGIAHLEKIDTFLELIVNIAVEALEAKSGALMLVDEKNTELYVKVASGLEDNLKSLRIKIDEEGPGWVAKHKKPLLIPQLDKLKAEDEKSVFSPPLLCVPLLYQDKLLGVFVLTGKLTGKSFTEDELLIISNLAPQTAVALENERLSQDAEKTYLETVTALAMAVEARDPYSRGHLDRVSQYSVKIAQKLNLNVETIKEIEKAAQLHDVGKIGISDEILKKDGLYSAEEAKIMHQHVIIGEGIIKPVRKLANLCDMVKHHHEWLDGTGYPDGLKGDGISLGARILCVADAFDAMTTDRPYHKALSLDEAKAELKKYVGIRYDANVVEALLSIL